ncbi:hypothetical protein [Streptomyces sp. CBMA123]|uniref:hypothetical protein n=1 Tax=Streptomyces sp. CBMA123 TaxID=1896313 RepID=UPI001661A67F|nr:hypothetical protein [Streptomyces sp. CBMA123]MBD0693583.1 hypothetical protein [Streptomyces sp. CBMA123]
MEVNGAEADSEDLKVLARASYSHFSSMQVRSRAVRGLDLHLKRLDDSTRELFGTGLDADRVRSCVWHALLDAPEVVTVRDHWKCRTSQVVRHVDSRARFT